MWTYVHNSQWQIGSRGDLAAWPGTAAEGVHRCFVEPTVGELEGGQRRRGSGELVAKGGFLQLVLVVVEFAATQAERTGLAAKQAGVATLVAAGVDQATLLALVERHLAGWAGRATQHPRRLDQRSYLRQICARTGSLGVTRLLLLL